ncbi:MAG: amino acid permease [Acidobacteria bacterium]|nr:MAG: amino acid permease [Acidobacteriota bacterium]
MNAMGSQRPNASQMREIRTLPREIGILGSMAIVVGTIIGSGIFLVPHNVAMQVGSVFSFYMVWVVGGALALAGALSLAELGAAMPEAGGIYVYLREAYGKLAAFLFGWGSLLVIDAGSAATLGVAFGIYASSFLPLTSLEQKILAGLVIAVLTVINILGVKKGTAVQTIFTIAKVGGLVIIIGCAIFLPPLAPAVAAHPLPTPHTTVSSFGVALVGVLWAYQGWHQLSYTAGEVKNPSKFLPLGFFLGTTIIIIVYLAANAAYLHVLPMPVIAEHQRVAATAMEFLIGPRGARFVSALILCSIFGALNGTILTASRVYYAMARDGVLFKIVSRIHPKFQTPAVAVIVLGAWSTILAISGSFEELYTYVIFAMWIFSAAAIAGVIILRRRLPDLHRPYRVWGYPILPIAFILAALAIVVNTLVRTPLESLLGLAIILAGVPLYYIWKRWGGAGAN